MTAAPVRQVAATGGDADPLALLLEGGNAVGAVAGSAFPATLQAALGEGAADAAEGTDLPAVGADDATDDDPAGTSLEAALAAALGVVVGPQAPASPSAADDGKESAVAPAAIATSTSGGNVGVAADLGAATAAAGAGTPTATAVTPNDATAVTPNDATAATPRDATAAAELAVATRAASADDAAVTARPAADATGDGTLAEKTAGVAPQNDANGPARVGQAAGHAVSADLATARSTSEAHGSGAGTHHGAIATTATTQAFSSGGSTQHGLDLGSSDRQASTAKPGESLTTATTAPTEKLQIVTAAPTAPSGLADNGHGDAARALPPVTTASAASEPPTARTPHTAQHPGGIEARWGERVVEALRLSGARGGGEIRLQLEPEGLGHIDVRLHLQQDGVRAVIVAEHESTRALLTSQQQVLQDAFTRSDLRLSSFSVDVGSGGGAATSNQSGADGQSGDAPSAPTAPAPTVGAADAADATTTSVVNGRVNVRV